MIKQFPKAIYKGDSVNKTFKITDTLTETNYVFKVGDKVKLGIKDNIGDSEYIIEKVFDITEESEELSIILTPEETQNIANSAKFNVEEEKAILEVEITYNDGVSVNTVYQENIELKGVVIDE